MGLLKKVARYNRPQAPSLNSSIPRHPRAKCRAADHAKRCGNDAFATVPLRGRNRGRVSAKKKNLLDWWSLGFCPKHGGCLCHRRKLVVRRISILRNTQDGFPGCGKCLCFLEMDPKYPPAIKGGNGKSFSWENHPSISIKVVSYHILSIATFEYPRVSVIGISLLGIAWLEWLNSNPGTLREIIP